MAWSRKGHLLLWEKDWGKMNSGSYCERIVSLIEGELSKRPWVSLTQDNAPPHTTSKTMQILKKKNNFPIFWPAFSLNLNPNEAA